MLKRKKDIQKKTDQILTKAVKELIANDQLTDKTFNELLNEVMTAEDIEELMSRLILKTKEKLKKKK